MFLKYVNNVLVWKTSKCCVKLSTYSKFANEIRRNTFTKNSSTAEFVQKRKIDQISAIHKQRALKKVC